jgi:hypothetical protein
LRARAGVAKARRHPRFGGPMGIIAIAVFLVVVAALNRFEFGRFD